MSHAYNEEQLVEQPAIQLFAKLGWQVVVALDEIFGPDGTLGRETPAEVVLVPRLRTALEKLNPSLPPETSAGSENHARTRLLAELAEVYCPNSKREGKPNV